MKLGSFIRKPRKCAVCPKFFEPITRLHKMCSPECRAKRSREVAKEWYKGNRDHHIKRVMECKRVRRAKKK